MIKIALFKVKKVLLIIPKIIINSNKTKIVLSLITKSITEVFENSEDVLILFKIYSFYVLPLAP